MRIAETFRSIQGETTRAGEPCVFVRLAGCPLRCHWCDTAWARSGGGTERTVAEVLQAVEVRTRLVCITGGEPLAQREVPMLARALLDAGHDVQVLTSGARSLAGLPAGVEKVVDVKTPWVHQAEGPDASGDEPAPHFLASNLARLSSRDEVKFVVRTRAEFDWAVRWADRSGLFQAVRAVLVGAAWGRVGAGTVADWILDSGRPIRLNLQWHKVLWGEGTRR